MEIEKLLMDMKEIDKEDIDNLNESKWVFEKKYDGSRHLIIKGNIISKRGINKNDRFSHIRKEIKDKDLDNLMLDAEIFIPNGTVIDLNSKENWSKAKICVFDILKEGNEDLRDRSYKERSEILEKHLSNIDSDIILTPKKFKEFRVGWKATKDNEWEGLVAKRKDSKYVSGKKSEKWKKIKTWKREDVEILKHEKGKSKGTFIVDFRGTEARVSGTSKEIVNQYRKNEPKKMEISFPRVTKTGKPFQPRFEKFIRK